MNYDELLNDAMLNITSIEVNISKKNHIVLKENIDILILNIDKNKSLVSAVITSCIKKIETPKQDIRLHRTDFEYGYSARSLDTKITSPFLKRNFSKYANKESSFLTLATREKIAWTLQDGQNLKIRNKELKVAFLNILDILELNKKDAAFNCLSYIFFKLTKLSNNQNILFESVNNSLDMKNITNINKVISILEKHFSLKLSSRLPVIAVYSVYQSMFPIIKRYDNKVLVDLKSHTSSDKHAYGDIEILNLDHTPYEIIEIKHNIPISTDFILDIYEKSKASSIQRYYILTTSKMNFVSDTVENEISNLCLEIKKQKNIDIIANGVITTLKYYLRFIEDYDEFMKKYMENLMLDARLSTEVQDFHIKQLEEILHTTHV